MAKRKNIVSTRKNYSFLPGCGKVSRDDYPKLQEELRWYLGCSTKQYYYKKRKEYLDMPAHIKEGIEIIFSRYGVEPSDIWSITDVDEKSPVK